MRLPLAPPRRSSGGCVSISAALRDFPDFDGGIRSDGVLGRDPAVELAGLEVAGHDRAAAVAIGLGRRLLIEPQVGLALAGVGPVALVAVVREDRPDVAVELDRLGAAGPVAALGAGSP